MNLIWLWTVSLGLLIFLFTMYPIYSHTSVVPRWF